MLKKNTQQKYLDRELGKLKKLLSEMIKSDPGRKTIHDLRICIKKIFALLELNKIRGYDPGNIHLLQLKELFRKAGTIRSSQVILEKLKKTGHEDKEIRGYHRKMIDIQTELLVSKVPDHLQMLDRVGIQIGRDYLYDLNNDEITRYHHLKSRYLQTIFTDPPQPALLHEGRKQVKHLLYISTLFRPELRKKFRINSRNVDLLQHLIGDWHDNAALLNFLEEMELETDEKVARKARQKMNDQFVGISKFLATKKIFQ